MSLDLTQDPADSTLWTGALPIPAGADPTTISYMVQATSGTGLVSLDTNGGAYTARVGQHANPACGHDADVERPADYRRLRRHGDI